MRSSSHRTRALMLTGALFVTGLTAAQSLALFTSSTEIPGNAFSTGTVVIGTDPATTLVTYSNMAPGDVVTQPLKVTNDGSLELRYAVTTSATDDDRKGLADQLRLTIKAEGKGCDAFDGETLYDGVIGSTFIGDPAVGTDNGDRTLAAFSGELLCVRAELPLATGDAYQDSATTATFSFSAEQTVNNP